MGLYLGFLAVVDASTLGEFRRYAINWQFSTGCQVRKNCPGFLSKCNWDLNTDHTESGIISIVLVRLIGVNKGRRVTLKYFSILIKVSRKHRLFIELI